MLPIEKQCYRCGKFSAVLRTDLVCPWCDWEPHVPLWIVITGIAFVAVAGAWLGIETVGLIVPLV